MTNSPLPRRIREIQPPVVPLVSALIARRPDTISLGQGVVRYGPPPEVGMGLPGFFDDPASHVYTPDWGRQDLVDALTEKLQAENGIDMAGRAVVVTAGANMGFLNSVLALTDPGDEVILFNPAYFNHEMAVRLAGCVPRLVETDGRMLPNVDAMVVAIGPRTRMVVTVSPNNPTGVTYPRSLLEQINAACAARGIVHVSDEAYEHFVYGEAEHYSPARERASAEHTIGLFSFSKSFGLASWRVGYMLVPERLFEPLMKVQDTNVICAPAISQHAARICLEVGSEYCRRHVAELARVRSLVLDELAALGERVTVPASDGAFYVYLRVNRDLDPFVLTERLILEHAVAVIPGSAFGSRECRLRVSYGALRPEAVREGIGRLVAGLEAVLG